MFHILYLAVVIVVYLAGQFAARPYKYTSLNALDVSCSFALLLLFTGSAFYVQEREKRQKFLLLDGSDPQDELGYVLATVVLLPCVACLVIALHTALTRGS